MLVYNKIKKYILDNDVTWIEVLFNINTPITTCVFNNVLAYCDKNFKGSKALVTINYGSVNKALATQELVTKMVIDNNVSYFKKQIVKTMYNKDYDFDVVLVDKTPIDTYSGLWDRTRDKIKYTYKININGNKYRIELSDMMDNTYEIEIKYKHKNVFDKNTVDDLNNLIFDMLLIINNTTFLYTTHMLQSLLMDLAVVDVTNKPATFVKDLSMPLVASLKAKGKRALLIIHKTGIWLVNQYYNLIVEPTDVISNLLYSWNMSVFDGNLIKPINFDTFNFNYKYWYLCYDCYCFRGKNVTQGIDYAKVLFNVITHYIDNNYFTFSLQTTLQSDTPDTLFNNVNTLLTLGKTINYKYNGIVFTSNNNKYKWQDIDHITVDFLVYPSNVPHVYKLYVLKDGQEVEFKGSKKYPFNNTLIDHTSFDLNYNGSKLIIACKWINNQFVNYKVRHDKTLPDNMNIVQDYWTYINNYISKKDIKGQTMYFANQYIKQIKKELKTNYKYKIFKPWDDLEELINNITNTVKLNDRVIFVLLSADAVNHLLQNNVSITLNDTVITKDLPMVHLNDLTRKLKPHHIELKQFEHITSPTLSTTSNIYTSLYVSGYYQKMHL